MVGFWHFSDLATDPDNVRFQGKTRSSAQTAKVTRLTHCRHWLHRWVRPKIYSLADLLGGLMSTINAATICIAAAKANGTT